MTALIFETHGEEAVTSRPAPLACSHCRSKHLRCDAAQPTCSRCDTDGVDCNYTPSRRGLAGRNNKRSHRPTRHGTTQEHRTTAATVAPALTFQPEYQSPQQRPSPGSLEPRRLQRMQATPTMTTPASDCFLSDQRRLSPLACALADGANERFVRLYYTMFHPGHPFLVPRSHYTAQAYPKCLTAVVNFIGGHYVSPPPGESARNETALAVASDKAQNIHVVQAALLFSIALHARNEPQNAMTYLSQAVDMAIGLGLNDPSAAGGKHDSIVAESYRRTWWELYVVDGYLSALHQQTSFRCNAVAQHQTLPCDDADYTQQLSALPTQSLEQFERRLFSDDPSNFSSFSYRIQASQILGKVIAVASSHDTRSEEVQALDAAIMSWKYNLPPNKESVINQHGEVDSMLAQAHVFINTASIMLHFPRSDLPLTLPNALRAVDCAKDIPNVPPTSAQHAIKAIAASKELANLAALPWLVGQQSPLLICGLVLACVVQLSDCASHACVTVPAHGCRQEHRDRVTLIMGVLKTFSRHWEIARRTLAQLKVVAKGIFDPQPPVQFPTPDSSSYEPVMFDAADTSWLNMLFADALQNQGLLGPDAAEF